MAKPKLDFSTLSRELIKTQFVICYFTDKFCIKDTIDEVHQHCSTYKGQPGLNCSRLVTYKKKPVWFTEYLPSFFLKAKEQWIKKILIWLSVPQLTFSWNIKSLNSTVSECTRFRNGIYCHEFGISCCCRSVTGNGAFFSFPQEVSPLSFYQQHIALKLFITYDQ